MPSEEKLLAQIRNLKARLKEADDTLAAIRKGDVDAFVIAGPEGDQIYTLKGADHPYRMLVQDMREGAVTLAADGLILYSNRRFAELVNTPLQRVIGSHLQDYAGPADADRAEALLREGARGSAKGEITLKAGDSRIPVFLSFNNLQIEDAGIVCLVVTDLTDQKRADEILAAETLARAILDQAAEAVVVVDRAGKVVRASRAAAALAGDNALFRPFDEVFPLCFEAGHPSGIQSARSLCAAASQGQTVKGLAAVLPRFSKPPAHVLASAAPLTGPKSEPLGCVVTLTDITAHRRVEQQLRVSEERRRVALEAASIGIWNWDLRTGQVFWAPECGPLFGLPPVEELTYERFLGAVHPEDRARVAAEVQNAFDGPMYEIEFRTLWPDGSIHWIASRGRVEVDAAGQPLRMRGTALNIDERRRMEDELRRAGDTVNAIIAGAPVAIWLVDVSGKIALWNPAAERLFGYTLDDVISRPGLFHLKAPARAEVLDRLSKGEVVVGLESACLTKSGATVEISLSTSALHNGDGSSRGFVALAVDVTEQKRIEEQIRQSQKLESIGLLAGGIAHDFNNLLTGIIGNASLIADEVPETSRRSLESVIKAGERAANLTRQLLAYAGKGQFFVEALDLSVVIRALLPLIRTSLPCKAEIVLDLEDELPAIHSDRSQVEQVIMNLAINAGEALNDAAGRIAIRTRTEDLNRKRALEYGVPPGRYAVIEVADTGCGMDEVTKAKIFEPFFTTKFTGRGLGLAAVHGVVRSCSGAIKVESQRDKGTRFTVLFPAIRQPASQNVENSSAEPKRASGVVLVVDDEEVIRATAQAALRRFGYTVITAVNGKEAVERFSEAQDRIDAVLLDVKMPVMDGFEALIELKRIRPDVKVLVSSGYNEEEALRAFKGEGVAGFLQKPYRAGVLAEAVRLLIAGEGKSFSAAAN